MLFSWILYFLEELHIFLENCLDVIILIAVGSKFDEFRFYASRIINIGGLAMVSPPPLASVVAQHCIKRRKLGVWDIMVIPVIW